MGIDVRTPLQVTKKHTENAYKRTAVHLYGTNLQLNITRRPLGPGSLT